MYCIEIFIPIYFLQENTIERNEGEGSLITLVRVDIITYQTTGKYIKNRHFNLEED